MKPLNEDQSQLFAESIKATMPGCKTQVQFNAFMAAFDAFRYTMNAIFEGKTEAIIQGRSTLEKAFEAAEKVTDLVQKIKDVPEAGGTSATQFTEPPTEFHEYDVYKKLMGELTTISTYDDLVSWYQRNRPDIDKVKTPSLRNGVLDEVRAKKLSFVTNPELSPDLTKS